MAKDSSAATPALCLLRQEYHGVLSTHSVQMAGFPFGSVAPYCLDANGCVIILISSIAQHTKNIVENNKVSFIVSEAGVDDVQTAARLTLMAEAQVIDANDEDTRQRYYRYFPSARGYHNTHNFSFYRLHSVRARYIGGFGKIHWLQPEQLQLSQTFSGADEIPMLDHMNADHRDAIEKYCRNFDINFGPKDMPEMVGIDSLGAHIRVGATISRITFGQQAENSQAVRRELVALARP